MATIIIRDTDDARTALAELIFADVDQGLDADEQEGGLDLWTYLMENLATLACNKTLAGCLSENEMNYLVEKAEKKAKDRGYPSPETFFFDN